MRKTKFNLIKGLMNISAPNLQQKGNSHLSCKTNEGLAVSFPPKRLVKSLFYILPQPKSEFQNTSIEQISSDLPPCYSLHHLKPSSNVKIISKSGSWKALFFLLPIIHYLSKLRRAKNWSANITCLLPNPKTPKIGHFTECGWSAAFLHKSIVG